MAVPLYASQIRAFASGISQHCDMRYAIAWAERPGSRFRLSSDSGWRDLSAAQLTPPPRGQTADFRDWMLSVELRRRVTASCIADIQDQPSSWRESLLRIFATPNSVSSSS